MTVLYFAYGSNLNIANMRDRCPAAEPLGSLTLTNSKLVFRGVADCIYEEGAECPGGVWQITDECEYALDRYEGVGSGMYHKEYIPVTWDGKTKEEMLLYVMNSTGIFPPSQGYLARIRQGYR